jgi:hypothetical protein
MCGRISTHIDVLVKASVHECVVIFNFSSVEDDGCQNERVGRRRTNTKKVKVDAAYSKNKMKNRKSWPDVVVDGMLRT